MKEYCVMSCEYPDVPHRTPPLYNEDESLVDSYAWCKEWVDEWEEIAPDAKPGLFYIAVRETTPWTKVYLNEGH